MIYSTILELPDCLAEAETRTLLFQNCRSSRDSRMRRTVCRSYYLPQSKCCAIDADVYTSPMHRYPLSPPKAFLATTNCLYKITNCNNLCFVTCTLPHLLRACPRPWPCHAESPWQLDPHSLQLNPRSAVLYYSACYSIVLHLSEPALCSWTHALCMQLDHLSVARPMHCTHLISHFSLHGTAIR